MSGCLGKALVRVQDRAMLDTYLEAHFAAMTRAALRAQQALGDLTRELEGARYRQEVMAGYIRTHYSFDEAAEALGVSLSTIRRRVDDGTITAVKLGRRSLIPIEDLDLSPHPHA
jgi:excisionase family DNA binding protein